MDQQRFDNLTRALGGATSRRGMLKVLAGALAGGVTAALGGRAALAGSTPFHCRTTADCGNVSCLTCQNHNCVSTCKTAGQFCNSDGHCTSVCLNDCEAPDAQGFCRPCNQTGMCCQDGTCIPSKCSVNGVCGCSSDHSKECTHDGCCASGEVCQGASGSTCCAGKGPCCDGKCCEANQICEDGMCKAKSKCDPPCTGCKTCSDVGGGKKECVPCSQVGLFCNSKGSGSCVTCTDCPGGCCDPGLGKCGCPNSGTCMGNGVCCSPPNAAVGNLCCPYTQVCQGTVKNICCHQGTKCTGKFTLSPECCPDGPRVCGNDCCAPTEECVTVKGKQRCKPICDACHGHDENGDCVSCLELTQCCNHTKCVDACPGCSTCQTNVKNNTANCVPCSQLKDSQGHPTPQCCYTSAGGAQFCITPDQCKALNTDSLHNFVCDKSTNFMCKDLDACPPPNYPSNCTGPGGTPTKDKPCCKGLFTGGLSGCDSQPTGRCYVPQGACGCTDPNGGTCQCDGGFFSSTCCFNHRCLAPGEVQCPH